VQVLSPSSQVLEAFVVHRQLQAWRTGVASRDAITVQLD